MKIEISLQKLGITSNNLGTSTGSEFFASGEKIESHSPVDGALIGTVSSTTKEDYERVIRSAEEKVMIVSPMSLFPMLQITVKALHNLKVEDSINEILKNVEKLSNHLNAYKTYHDKLGNTLGTAVNHYNDSTKEFKKIDKDVIKISSGNSKLNITSEDIEKPLLED